jgi:hypothetical protein
MIPFGPFNLWTSPTTVVSGPAPFTASIATVNPGSIVKQLAAARTLRLKLICFLAGGAHAAVMTGDKFDLTKWKKIVDGFNTAEIRNAIASAVADQILLGNSLLDEPPNPSWGGNLTRPMLDEMASHALRYFPTLPMGVNFGGLQAANWRPDERFRVVGYTVNQYNAWATNGNIALFRDKVLARAKLDGVTPVFSMNLLDGGVQDKDGIWDCKGAGQAGQGTKAPKCRMPAAMVRAVGTQLGPAGAALLLWKYDDAFMRNAENQQAFRDIAAALAPLATRSLRRPGSTTGATADATTIAAADTTAPVSEPAPVEQDPSHGHGHG